MIAGLEFKLVRHKTQNSSVSYCILIQLRFPGSMITLKSMTEIITFVF